MKNKPTLDTTIQLIHQKFLEINEQLVTCESCTSGLLSHRLSYHSGASKWYSGGWITYSHHFKNLIFSSCIKTHTEHGSVSEQGVGCVAESCLQQSKAHHALVLSGIAGPSGETAEKPIGICCIAYANIKKTTTQTIYAHGSRQSNQLSFVEQSLAFLLEEVSK